MFRIFPPITLKFLPFFPYHLPNQYIVKCAWEHTHILNIWIKLLHWHWVMVLTSWNICCHHLPWLRQKSSHILLNFSHNFRKFIQLTYLKIAMSKPRCSPINQVPLCSFECSYLYNYQVKMYHCWSILEDISEIERSVEATVDKWTTDPFTAYSMQTSRLFCWTVMNSIFSAKSSIDAAVCLISSPTCSWWLPSSSWIAGHSVSPKISH